jgi:hypothetical protein
MIAKLNDKVWVKLTDQGIEQLTKIAEETESRFERPGIAKLIIANCKRGDWHEFTFGDLMRNFGSICHSGFGTPFVGNEVLFKSPY